MDFGSSMQILQLKHSQSMELAMSAPEDDTMVDRIFSSEMNLPKTSSMGMDPMGRGLHMGRR